MGGFSFFVVGLTIIGDGWRFRLRWLISLMVDGGFDHGQCLLVGVFIM